MSLHQFSIGDEINFDIQAFDPEAETAPVTLLPYVQATVREVMTPDDDPSIAPDYWLTVNCIASGHEFEIRASYVSPGL